MADEAKLPSPLCSIFEVLGVPCVVGHCCGKELGPLCRPVPAAGLQFSAFLIDLLSVLLRYNGFAGIQKAVMERWGEDHQTVTTIFFGYRSGFGKRFRASSQSSH